MPAGPSVPLWVLMTALGALGTLITVGIYMIASHFREDHLRAERLAVAENEIKNVKAEIGDRKSGIRGWLHELANDISPYIIRKQGERKE